MRKSNAVTLPADYFGMIHGRTQPLVHCSGGPLEEEADAEGMAEAEQAAAAAHDKSHEPDDIIDALEAAEATHSGAYSCHAVSRPLQQLT